MPAARHLSESTITQDLGKGVCQRITRQTIRAMQAMTDCLLSGDDSGLSNTWDEICVQLQVEQSFAWTAYDETVQSFVAGRVANLKRYEQEAAWLLTEEGSDWQCESQEDRESSPVMAGDIVRRIVENHVYSAAENWSNPRIMAHLARQCD